MADLTLQTGMQFSPAAESYLSTDTEGPFGLDRYRANLEPESADNYMFKIDFSPPPSPPPPPPHPTNPTMNQKPMTVDGHGLRDLADITIKAELAASHMNIELEATPSAKVAKCLSFAENRRFVCALYELEVAMGTTAAEVLENEELFQNIDAARITSCYKQLCKAMRDLCQPLQQMVADCGHEKYIRICRKYVVRVLRRINHHYGKLIFAMEREVERVWVGPMRYGDDVNAKSLLSARVEDWLQIEPRIFDKIFCRSPDFVIPLGGKEDVFI